jgi:quinol-cytochrome oxidoreductase complex cytochrome b subunit
VDGEREEPWTAVVRVERYAALSGLALAGALLVVTGAVLIFYYGPRAAVLSVDEIIRSDLVGGMVTRNLHRWGTRAIAVVVGLHVTFLLVARLSVGSGLSGAQRARVASASLGAALALLLAAVLFVPWDSVAGWMAMTGTEPAPLLHQQPPLPDLMGVDARYDARALLTAGSSLAVKAIERRFWMVHGIVLPVLTGAILVLHLRWGNRVGREVVQNRMP